MNVAMNCIVISFFFVLLLGEKLSKQQLQHSNIIKKLRAKEKESDTRLIKQEKKIKELGEELKLLQQVLIYYSVKCHLYMPFWLKSGYYTSFIFHVLLMY